jgi:hypothetical protein
MPNEIDSKLLPDRNTAVERRPVAVTIPDHGKNGGMPDDDAEKLDPEFG